MDENASARPLPVLTVRGPWNWDEVISGVASSALLEALAEAITSRRWFGSKARAIESLGLVDAVAVSSVARLLLLQIRFSLGSQDIYQVPLAFAEGPSRSTPVARDMAAWIRVESEDGVPLGFLCDALDVPDYCNRLLALFTSADTLVGAAGTLVPRQTSSFESLRGPSDEGLTPRAVLTEQSNSSVIYGERLILKVFRRVERGLNPDIEISAYLTQRRFANTPALAGSLEYRGLQQEHWALGMLQALVPNQGDAWHFTVDWLTKLSLALAERPDSSKGVPAPPSQGICRAAGFPVPTDARAAFGEFLAKGELLGKRTAEMHLALASDPKPPAFAPEPFSAADRREYFRRCAAEARSTFELLRHNVQKLAIPVAERARRVAALEGAALARFARSAEDAVVVNKIRCHGDYHLGQVLVAGGDFMIVDFEGEPARSIDERRQKQLALRDVAGMIRSLHYASCTAAAARRTPSAPDTGDMARWMHSWFAWTSVSFLAAYLRTAGDAHFVPKPLEQLEALLECCLLEKAMYELRYELNNRPNWVYLPLAALEELLDHAGHDTGRTDSE